MAGPVPAPVCLHGAVTLLAIVAVTRRRLPLDRPLLGHLLVVAVLMNALPFVLFAYGETAVSSVLAGLLNATTPLLTLLFALGLLPAERPRRARAPSGGAAGSAARRDARG